MKPNERSPLNSIHQSPRLTTLDQSAEKTCQIIGVVLNM
jgi:hypothetical protein